MARKPILDNSQVAVATALYVTDGLSLDAIAEKFDCSAVTVANALRRAGVAIKRQGRPYRHAVAPAAQATPAPATPAEDSWEQPALVPTRTW